MKSLLFLIIQIIDLYQLVLIIYVIATWLVGFRIINTTNAFVYSILTALYKICEPSMRIVKKFIPNAQINFEKNKVHTPLIDDQNDQRIRKEINFNPRSFEEGVKCLIDEVKEENNIN